MNFLTQREDTQQVKPASNIQPLEPRRETNGFGPFHRGTHAPVAIRWFGMTALVGHLKHLVAVAAASKDLDLRDWMRPEDAAALLNRVRVRSSEPRPPEGAWPSAWVVRSGSTSSPIPATTMT